ncbi:MAG TPA: hypothetical protein VD836_10325 [Solirubrobacteraceae bacterium]|nr:hypothetical protein [Solirubrobacteraceae bacterium]
MPLRTHARVAIAAAALLVALALPAAAHAATAITIGAGHKPGVAVDAAGTAYVAWYADEGGPTKLRFCRLPRGAVACESAHQITVPNSSLSRPFVTVSGSTVRIAQYRYPLSGPIEAGVWEFTSTDRGANFDAGHRIGSIPFNEAVQGPGDTISAATNAEAGGLGFQNMPLGGGSAGTDTAILSGDHPYNGSVGLVNAGTPLTVFSAGDGQSQFRRYDGTGSVNDESNWTPATDLGYADYPRLAGGPTGLFLLAGTPSGGLEVRRYNGVTFGPGVALAAAGDDAQDDITQDAAGRLHAVFPQGRADGLHLVHATSDDGGTWRSGTVLIETRGVALASLRAAVAPDHIGVVAWETGSSGGTTEVRIAGIGPDAPVDPAPPAPVPIGTPGPPPVAPAAKLKGRLPTNAAKAKRISRGRVRLTLDGKLGRPAGVSAAQGCRGSIVATVRRGKKRIARDTLPLSRSCRFHRVGVLSRKKVKRASKLRVTLRFRGNAALAGTSRSYTVKLQKRR